MLSLSGAIIDVGDTLVRGVGVSEEVLIELGFIEKLRVLGVYIFKFDGHLLVGFGVYSLKDLAEGTGS
jgi:hypothetical protein